MLQIEQPTIAMNGSPQLGLQPAYPWAWEGCVAAYAPALGRQGNTLYDWSGYGNHGTLTNIDPATDYAAANIKGQSCYGLDFDGSSSRVDADVVGDLSECTLWAWVKFSALADKTVISVADKSVSNQQYRILTTGAGGLGGSVFDGTVHNTSGVTVTTNTWLFVACAFYGSDTIDLYVNNRLRVSLVSSYSVSGIDRVTIGVTADSTPFGYLNGACASAGVIRGRANSSQIAALYKIGPLGPYQFQLPTPYAAAGGAAADFPFRKYYMGGCGV